MTLKKQIQLQHVQNPDPHSSLWEAWPLKQTNKQKEQFLCRNTSGLLAFNVRAPLGELAKHLNLLDVDQCQQVFWTGYLQWRVPFCNTNQSNF